MMEEGRRNLLDKKNLVNETESFEFDSEHAWRDWDICIVFTELLEPRDKDGNSLPENHHLVRKWNSIREQREKLRKSLTEAGLKTKKKIVQKLGGDSIMYLLVSASQERLEIEAERIELQMKLKPLHGGAYAPFEIEKKHLFELGDPIRGALFRKTQIINLIETIMESDDINGAKLSISHLKYEGVITKIFPFHSLEERDWLVENWAKPKNIFKSQPLEKIQLYFGEELAMYFAWLGFYTSWLWIASFAGIITTFFWGARLVGGPNNGENETWAVVFYAVFLALWATFFLEYWKRFKNSLVYNWGMEDYELKERPRADYNGILLDGLYYNGEWIEPPWGEPIQQKRGLIGKIFGTRLEGDLASAFEGEDEKKEKVDIFDIPTPKTIYYPSTRRFGKIGAAGPIIVTMIMIVVIITLSIFSFRLFMQTRDFSGAGQVGAIFGGLFNAIAIIFMNQVWRRIADILTRWENHRTATSFQNQLIFKIFMFQFANSYSSLYYIGFIKSDTRIWGSPNLEDRCRVGTASELGKGCVDELAYQVAAILAANIFIGQATEVFLPWLNAKIRSRFYQKSTMEDVLSSQYEKEGNWDDYPGTFDEYNEMVIQYGYITLFAASFPLAPLMAVLNNLIEIRTDASKFLLSYNRPFYRGSQGIGTWYVILEVLGVIAVTTNCLLITFSYSTLYQQLDHNPLATLGVAMIIEHLLFVLKFIIAVLIPDMPGRIRKARAKESYIKEETFKKLSSGTRVWEKKVKTEEEQFDEFEEVYHKRGDTVITE